MFTNFGLSIDGIPSLGGPPERISLIGIECFVPSVTKISRELVPGISIVDPSFTPSNTSSFSVPSLAFILFNSASVVSSVLSGVVSPVGNSNRSPLVKMKAAPRAIASKIMIMTVLELIPLDNYSFNI